jgi:hypothetical protein
MCDGRHLLETPWRRPAILLAFGIAAVIEIALFSRARASCDSNDRHGEGKFVVVGRLSSCLAARSLSGDGRPVRG